MNGIPKKTALKWIADMASRGLQDTDGIWARGFARGELVPYREVRFKDDNWRNPDPSNCEVSFDGVEWRTYDKTRDRGI